MKNAYEIRGDVVAIFLRHQGRAIECLIDAADFGLIDSFAGRWSVLCLPRKSGTPQHYAHANKWPEGRPDTLLHRLLMQAEATGQVVDHINHDGLDNRRSNLRLVTAEENAQNALVFNPHNHTSGVRGVTWDRSAKCWRAQYKTNGHVVTVGYFEHVRDAAIAISRARKEAMPGAVEPPESELLTIPDPDRVFPVRTPKIRRATNTSGFQGVVWEERTQRWIAQISYRGRHKKIGRYRTPQEASRAYEEFKAKVYAPGADIEELFKTRVPYTESRPWEYFGYSERTWLRRGKPMPPELQGT